VDEAASGWVWKHQETIAIPDMSASSVFPTSCPLCSITACDRTPISTPSPRFGALGLGKSAPEELNHEDVEFLSCVALMGALALERDRAHHAPEEQQSLVAISRELSSSLELEGLLPVILSSLRSIARYDRAVLSLMDENGKNIHLYGDALEWEPFVNHGSAVALEQSLSARAIQTRSVAFFCRRRFARHERSPGECHVRRRGPGCLQRAPRVAGNRIWGAFH
jgi:transcriptional regulator with GAF, ATPase, and Fis domain